MARKRKGCYLIHIEDGTHYVGWAEDIDARLDTHEKTICLPPTPEEIAAAEQAGGHANWAHHGHGAHYMGVINYKGLHWREARVWLGRGRDFELWLKSWGGKSKICPVCLGEQAYKRAQGGTAFERFLKKIAHPEGLLPNQVRND